MDLSEYQNRAYETKITDDHEVFFLGLIGEVGSIFSAYKKLKRSNGGVDKARDEIAQEIGDALWYLAAISSFYEINLNEIAEGNLQKTSSYYLGDPNTFYDSDYPESEQFPRQMYVKFEPDPTSTEKIITIINDVHVGDNLDDNASSPDGYRFHDIFHVAFATHLHWSPVLRKLLSVKRKSNDDVDRIQDGARAAAIEEAITAYVFAEQQHKSSFVQPEDIPFTLLETIKRITANLEVHDRTIQQWQQAISDGFRCFNELNQKGGGRIHADLNKRKITMLDSPV